MSLQGSSHSSTRSPWALREDQALHQLLLHEIPMRISHSLFLQGHLVGRSGEGVWQDLDCQALGLLSSGHLGVFWEWALPDGLGYEGMIFFEWLDYHFQFCFWWMGCPPGWDDPSVLSACWDWMLWAFLPNGAPRLGSMVCQTILKQGY